MNIDFDQTTTDDLIDKTNLFDITYNQDFQIKLDENNVNILTSPLPPLSVKELDKNNFLVKVDIKVALAVFKKYDIFPL